MSELVLEPPATARDTVGPAGPRADTRVLRISLLGLGNVGRAFVELCAAQRPLLAARGLELRVTAALVRDARRPRGPLPDNLVLTTEPGTFLAESCDLAVEVLGGVEPAATLVRRLLLARVPVVTANKSLLAARGAELRALAAARRVPLRCEAAVIAGLPFLGAHARRPLAGSLTHVAGILNGTSNYILTALHARRGSFAQVLAEAQARGYAEPDPGHDLDGVDAAEKLAVLLGECGVADLRVGDFEVQGIRGLSAGVLADARALRGILKPVAFATLGGGVLHAFVGPAYLPRGHALARLAGVVNGVLLRSTVLGELSYAGPGAGPAVTAATIIDDVVEIACQRRGGQAAPAPAPNLPCRAPDTPWFVRLVFADAAPPTARVAAALAAYGVWLTRVHRGSVDTLAGLTTTCSRARLAAALANLRDATRCATTCVRVLED